MSKRFCDGNCNECPIIGHPNSRELTVILNELVARFGDDAYAIVQARCPNLTCCYDCHIDDFCHFESGCELLDEAQTCGETEASLPNDKELRDAKQAIEKTASPDEL
jgi:hypothetical protein